VYAEFLASVERKGELLRSGLREALGGNPHVKEVRGLGLICGVQLDVVSAMVGWGAHRVYASSISAFIS